MKRILLVALSITILTIYFSSVLANEVDEDLEVLLQIDDALRQKDFNTALKLNNQLKEKDPSNYDHYRREALIYAEAARAVGTASGNRYYQDALILLDNTIHLAQRSGASPKEIAALYNDKAYIHWDFENYRGVIEEAQKALRLDPNNAIAYSHLGNATMWLGYLMNPENPPKEYVERSAAYYTRAIELSDENDIMPYAYYFVAAQKYEQQDYITVKKYLMKFIEQMYFLSDIVRRELSYFDLLLLDKAIETVAAIDQWLQNQNN